MKKNTVFSAVKPIFYSLLIVSILNNSYGCKAAFNSYILFINPSKNNSHKPKIILYLESIFKHRFSHVFDF